MQAPLFWWREPGIEAALLKPFAMLYGAVAARRLAMPGQRVGVPVVCIGNPTVGGAGKTPTALAVAELLAAAGERPVFLTRGYGGRLAGPIKVDLSLHRADLLGDEPLLLARAFPTVVARDRVAGARAAQNAGATVIVMDDGFQNPSLAKDISLLVIDSSRGAGNGNVFPAGPLRAPLGVQIRRAQAMLVVGGDPGGVSAIAAASAARVPIFRGRIELDSAAKRALSGHRVLAFAGIGDPEKFFRTLAGAGIAAPLTRSFPDHHRYTEAEAASLLHEAEQRGLLPVTTEKDFVRLDRNGAIAKLRSATRPVPITLVVDDDDGFRRFLLVQLNRGA